MSSTDKDAPPLTDAQKAEAERQKAIEDAKESQMGFGTKFIEWFPCVIYVILYVVLDVLIASEGYENPQTGKREYRYTAGVLVFLGEAGKLVISVILLLLKVGVVKPANDVKKNDDAKAEYAKLPETEDLERNKNSSNGAGAADAEPVVPKKTLDFKLGVWYMVPAALYTVWNVVNYVSLLHVSLSVYSIIYQSVLFFSAFLWSVTFKRKLTLMQWFALTLLAVGVFVVHIKIPFKVDIHLSALWVLLQAFISAVASVYNEFLYKRPEEKHNTIHQQNTYLYIFTTFFSFFYVMGTEGPAIFLPANFFRGFSVRVVFIVFVSIALGISVSLILKHRNVIVKLYAQAIHSPLEVVAAHIFLHTELTWMIIIASLLIGVSTWLYYKPAAPPPPPKVVEDETNSQPASAPSPDKDGPSTDAPNPTQPSLWEKTHASPKGTASKA